ncbi:hypothetical protein MMP74_10380 [Acinetobacter sp. NIPH 1869]|uniref:hypothetical protein n=1 Tax=Acinetobacter higginsii TaxID=70347 RepID=UPI001F4B1C5D|nr:hypothetical protein [Acinetobacter higginsii]MCH7304780.1 hypothetical protein [Acinetobacter higginsii]
MKYLILGVLSGLLSFSAFAYDTNSMRSSYELVSVGDSESDLLRKMGKPKPRYFVYRDGRSSCAATEYVYEIDMQVYTVLVCNGAIFKIDVKGR